MSQSVEKLAVVALLPEIAAGEELANVNPGLILSDGTAVQAGNIHVVRLGNR